MTPISRSQSCPPREVLRQVLDGGTAQSDERAIREHVRQCVDCQRNLDDATDDPELLAWKNALFSDSRHWVIDGCHDLVNRILHAVPIVELPGDGESSVHLGRSPIASFARPPGTRLDSFELLEELGRGGMGVVYKARDLELDRIVALKLVPFLELEDQARSRFLREAKAAARVKHDHVVALHAVRTADDGSSFLVMEFVDGSTLREWIKTRGPIDSRTAAELLAQAATGLQAIHDANLVHCDVKPSNILLCHEASRSTGTSARATAASIAGSEGQPDVGLANAELSSFIPKITDFGLARLVTADRTMTREGMLAGTPIYMSPEQLQGDQELDARSDVYSLGVTFYEALTGTVPFSGTPQMVMRQIEHVQPRRPSALNEAVPRDLETICLKAMAKEPGRRYESAQAFADDLQRWLAGEPILARPAGTPERFWRWCRRNPRIALLSSTVFSLLLCLTAVSSASFFWVANEQQKTERQKVAAERSGNEAKQNAAIAQQAQERAESLATSAQQQRNLALEAHVNLVRGVQDRLADTPGTLALRKELLEAAAAGLERIVTQSGSSEDSDRTLFLAHQRLGDAYLVLGRTADAQKELEQAKKIAQSLFDRSQASSASKQPDPGLENAKMDLAAACTSLGEFHLKSLNYKLALSDLQHARELLDELAATNETDANLDNQRIRVLSNLGDVALRLGNPSGEANYQAALSLAEKMQSQKLLAPQSRRVVESVLRRLGDAALLRGEFGKGVDYYRRSLQSAESAGLAAVSFSERNGLVDTYGRVGLILAWLGEADDAESCFHKAVELNDEAARAEPENLTLQRKSAIFQQRFGDVAWSRGDYDSMRKHLLAAFELHLKLSQRDPASTQSQNDLVICLEQLGRMEAKIERYQDADKWFEQAAGILQSRKQAGTLTDPVSLGFESSIALGREVLRHLPAALEDASVFASEKATIAAAIVGERAIVQARRGKIAAAEEELNALAKKLTELQPLEQTAMQLVVARAHALCARNLHKQTAAIAASEPTQAHIQIQKHQDQAVAALEKYISADPFNATYLGFEYELQSLREHTKFQQLVDRFRNPKK